jgi:RNA polymerase sigma factor (TIGR02999 family)
MSVTPRIDVLQLSRCPDVAARFHARPREGRRQPIMDAQMEPAMLTELLRRARDGDADAARALFDAVYPHLRRIARARLRGGRRGALLDTGSLVNESYLRFASAGRLQIEDRVHFMRWAGRVMRSVIVDLTRRSLAERRGGGAPHLSLTTNMGKTALGEDQILRVHEALEDLATADARLAQVVEMRYFAGMTESEIAEALGISDRTVRRDWEKARLLLQEALS